MAGEKMFSILIIYLTLINLSYCQSEPSVFIRGGVLFEKCQETPVNINPPTALFTRYLDFTDFEKTIAQSKIFEKSYEEFCNNLNNEVLGRIRTEINTRYILTKKKHKFSKAYEACRAQNGRLPGIHNKLDYRELTRYADDNYISIVVAGIEPDYHNSKIIFSSTNTPARVAKDMFGNIFVMEQDKKTHKPCKVGSTNYEDNECLDQFKVSSTIAYKTGVYYNGMTRDWDLAFLTKEFAESPHYIICEKMARTSDEDIQADMVLRMAAHACMRDNHNVVQMSKLITEEATRFVHVNMENINKIFDEYMSKRVKRDVSPLFENFAHELIDPDTFCNISQYDDYSTRNNKFKVYLNTLYNVSTKLAENLMIPDTIIANFISYQMLHQANIINFNNFSKICQKNYFLNDLDRTSMPDDISRILDFINITTMQCSRWYNYQNYPQYIDELHQSKEAIFSTIPVLHAFMNLDYSQKFSANGNNLTNFNENMQNFIEYYIVTMEELGYYNTSTQSYKEALFEILEQRLSVKLSKELKYSLTNIPIRHKRFMFMPPLLLGGMLTSAISINDINNGDAALSFIGKGMAALTGLVHKDDLKPQIELLKNHSVALKTLLMNQNELEVAYSSMANTITQMDEFARRMEFSTATMFQQLDHKMVLQSIMNVVQSTIMKVASVRTNAKMHLVSPYLMDKAELETLATQFRSRLIPLSDNLDDIFVQMYINKKNITYTLRIPIVKPENLFHVYRATPIPIFKDGKVFKVKTDILYLAHSASRRMYSILSEDEYYLCRQFKYCRTVDVLRPISTISHCVMKTLDTNKQHCPMEEIEEREPFYYVFSNNLIYSVEEPQTTNLICTINGQFNQTQVQLDGFGTAKIAPGCTIIFKGGMEVIIHPEAKETNLGQIKFMEIHKYIPKSDDYNIVQVKEDKESNIFLYTPDIKQVETSFFDTILEEIVNPNQVLPEMFRVLAGIAIAILVFIVICTCFPKVGIWFKSCIFWKNPKTWWVDIQKYDLATFEKHRQTIQNRLKETIANLIHNNTKPAILHKQDKIAEEELKMDSLLDKMKKWEAAKAENSPTPSRKVQFSEYPEVHTPKPIIKNSAPMYPVFSYTENPQAYYDDISTAPPQEDDSDDDVRQPFRRNIVLDQPTYSHRN